MAISKNLYTRGLQQRLGGVVFYQQKGRTLARELAPAVSNPQTSAQMQQRTRLANVVAMYRANRQWMARLAFQGRKSTWSVYNAFVSANLSTSQVYLSKSEATRGFTIVSPYKVTNGTLPAIDVYAASSVSGGYATNLYLGGAADLANLTVGTFTQALLANNNGLSEGMQLSLVVNYQVQNNDVYNAVVRYFEVILDTTDTALLTDRLGDSHLAIVDDSLGFRVGDSDPTMAFTFVLSHTTGGQTLVSPQWLTLTDTSLYDSFVGNERSAAESYGSSDEQPFLESSYQYGSNDNVSLPSSILGIRINRSSGNDETLRTAGDYVAATAADTAVVVEFNKEIPAPSAATVVIGAGGNPTTLNVTELQTSGKFVTIPLSGKVPQGSDNRYYGVSVLIQGLEYSIEFRVQQTVTE